MDDGYVVYLQLHQKNADAESSFKPNTLTWFVEFVERHTVTHMMTWPDLIIAHRRQVLLSISIQKNIIDGKFSGKYGLNV